MHCCPTQVSVSAVKLWGNLVLFPLCLWGYLAGRAQVCGHSAVAKTFQLGRVGPAILCTPAHRGASVRAPESHSSILHPGAEFLVNRLKKKGDLLGLSRWCTLGHCVRPLTLKQETSCKTGGCFWFVSLTLK